MGSGSGSSSCGIVGKSPTFLLSFSLFANAGLTLTLDLWWLKSEVVKRERERDGRRERERRERERGQKTGSHNIQMKDEILKRFHIQKQQHKPHSLNLTRHPVLF